VKVRLTVARYVRQVGILEMDAKSKQEAFDCVRLLSKQIAEGKSVEVAAEWTKDMRVDRLEVLETVEAA
jgi:hypothetical protein